ncbi:AbrB/MazE/SpoVT family DNA-binding domain-containing protein [Aneurinibacillus tyrosinisolvens]|uniref:AbrB/MazE/SpoVT family DNA-binding domain-containing protein n=1 Tax=Aneurinibacillus tyrosinisolvens TaxID=1443435 RepID=UPI00063F8E35|nr:AbrB/MazE/SpoVT family DNA-binding domain-containing protein [Aneurinibacillus tyrosinisolvens]
MDKLKATGIIRKIDHLGRVVLPIELRQLLNIEEKKDRLEISSEGEFIILKKLKPACLFCSSTSRLHNYKERTICDDCWNQIGSEKDGI